MTKLRKAMMEAMLLRGFSERTKESYIQGVRGIAAYYHLSPDRLGDEQVRGYLIYLLDERKLAYSSANLALNAIRFLFREVLRRPPDQVYLPGPRQPQRLPEILSREQVGRILEAATDLRHKTLLMTTYAAGLRVSALCHLRVKDIDSDRMGIRVEQGKGAKDRYTLLSPHLPGQLRLYWRTYQSADWLFVHRNDTDPLPVGTVQKIFHRAKDKAGTCTAATGAPSSARSTTVAATATARSAKPGARSSGSKPAGRNCRRWSTSIRYSPSTIRSTPWPWVTPD